jgi:addiction module HigA family antidote
MKMAGNTAVLVPAHPGMILREEFMKGLGLTPYKVAKAIKVPLPRLNDIVRETRGISPEMGLRLSAYFGTNEQYWINLQADYERRVAKAKLADKLKEIQPLAAA